MSSSSVNLSLGLCLSTNSSNITTSAETGEAFDKSVTAESLSLTKISLPVTTITQSQSTPLLIKLPQKELIFSVDSNPPRLLTLSGNIEESLTPSGALEGTLEGTLEDFPDDFDSVPLAVVIKSKPAQENVLHSSSFITPERTADPIGLSPPSPGSSFLPDDSRKVKKPSSVRSFASSVHKTSTSGITVVEVHKYSVQSKGSKSSSIKSDTMKDISVSISSEKSMSESENISKLSIFEKFNPQYDKLPKMPMLLQLDHGSPDTGSQREVLSPQNDNNLSKPKKWGSKDVKFSETLTPTCSNSSSSTPSKHKRGHIKQHKNYNKVVNMMEIDGVKDIIKNEMKAVVDMQNDIWHGILKSFMEKGHVAHDRVEYKNPEPQPTYHANMLHYQNNALKRAPPGGLLMLKLPDEVPSYTPADIPIIKPKAKSKPKMMLTLPSENEPASTIPKDETDENIEKDKKDENIENNKKDEDIEKDEKEIVLSSKTSPLKMDANIQTETFIDVSEKQEDNHPPAVDKINKVVKIMPVEEPLIAKPLHRQKPPSENLEYQKSVNDASIPTLAYKECQMLLESIQRSANELKEMKRDFENQQNRGRSPETKHKSFLQIEKVEQDRKHILPKTKHDIFLEGFFNEGSRAAKPRKFLDITDLSGKRENGHFVKIANHVSKPTKASKPSKTVFSTKPSKREFLHTTNIRKTKDCISTTKAEEKAISKSIQNEQRPVSPGEISEKVVTEEVIENIPETKDATNDEAKSDALQKSESLSSIGKYLSSEGDDTISIKTDRTITPEHFDCRNSFSFSEHENSLDEIRSDILEDDVPDYHSTPLSRDIPQSGHDSVHEKENSDHTSSTYTPVQPKDPTVLSKLIAENIAKMKSKFDESVKQDIDRARRVNTLLTRHKPKTGHNQTEEYVLNQAHSVLNQPDKHTVKPVKMAKVKGDTYNLPQPTKDDTLPYQYLGEGSAAPVLHSNPSNTNASSDSTLPSQTEDIIEAALNSEGSFQQGPKKALQEKRELSAWTESKRQQRMKEYKAEREKRIQAEKHPYKPNKNKASLKRLIIPRDADKARKERKKAILRRLNDAENLMNDIVTTKPEVKKKKVIEQKSASPDHLQQKTSQWLDEINDQDFDTINSPSLLSDRGASQLSSNVSLP